MVVAEKIRGRTRGLFTDLDGTLTTAEVICPSTIAALQRLRERGLSIVVATGRPSSWGQSLLTCLPIDGVITENGAVTYYRRGGDVEKTYALSARDRRAARREMHAVLEELRAGCGDLVLSDDSRGREVDLAIDWNENVRMDRERADALVRTLVERGFVASRSSVHVNFGPHGIDKGLACKEVLARYFGVVASDDGYGEFVYIGDSHNDAPAFAIFRRSVGVASVHTLWEQLASRPAHVTAGDGGRGVEELVSLLLESVGDPP